MKKIKLSRGQWAWVDNSDFDYLNQWKWSSHSVGGYACRRDKGKSIYMHRLIMNTPDGFDTDHINGRKNDNRRKNLRIVSRSMNMFNTPKKSNNKSGYKGVHRVSERVNPKNRWVAQITNNRKSIFLGYFNTAKKAHSAYLAKRKEIMEEKTYILTAL